MSAKFIDLKCSRTALVAAIEELHSTVDDLLNVFMDNDLIQNHIEDINELDDLIEQLIVFCKSIVITNCSKKGVDAIRWQDHYNREFGYSCIPYEYSKQVNHVMASESPKVLESYSHPNESILSFYILERNLSILAFAVELLSLLDVYNVDGLEQYKDTQHKLMDKINDKAFHHSEKLMSLLMYHALHSKDDTIRDRFVALSEM